MGIRAAPGFRDFDQLFFDARRRAPSKRGVDLRVLPSGCCGMAGLYGHEKANRARSEKIYQLSGLFRKYEHV